MIDQSEDVARKGEEEKQVLSKDLEEQQPPSSDPFLTCEKSLGNPDQVKGDRSIDEMENKASRKPLTSNRTQDTSSKVKEWFQRIHGPRVGHGGMEATIRKLFEIAEVRRSALKGKLPIDLISRLKELIKSCPNCQKLAVTKSPAQAEHFTCSVYEPMKRFLLIILRI